MPISEDEWMEQITIMTYIKEVNKETKCRHAIGNYCYIKKKDLDINFMCPCDDYEQRLLCDGCKYNRKGLKHCLEDPVCKRYCFSPAVKTKDNPDKWEANDHGNDRERDSEGLQLSQEQAASDNDTGRP